MPASRPPAFVLPLLVASALGSSSCGPKQPVVTAPSSTSPPGGASDGAVRAGGKVAKSRRVIATIPADVAVSFRSLVFAPFGKHVAYVGYDPKVEKPGTRNPSHGFVVLDNTRDPEFQQIGDLVFSHDGAHLAYESRTGDLLFLRSVIVADGRKVGEDEETAEDPFFDAQGELGYFARKKGGKDRLVLGQRTLGADFDEIWPDAYSGKKLTFQAAAVSADAKHFAFAVRKGGQTFAAVDGAIVGPGFAAVSELHFSAGGSTFAYVGMTRPATGDPLSLIVNGQKIGGSFSIINQVTLSADGKRVAFVASDHDHPTRGLYVDGARVAESSFLIIDCIAPTGEVVYNAVDLPKNELRIGKRSYPPENPKTYDIAANAVFSADGKHMAFVGIIADKNVPGGAFPASNFVAYDGVKKWDADLAIEALVISPDGAHVAWASNALPIDMNANLIDRGPLPHGSVFVDGKRMAGAFDDVHGMSWQSGGKVLAFGAKQGSELVWIEEPVL